VRAAPQAAGPQSKARGPHRYEPLSCRQQPAPWVGAWLSCLPPGRGPRQRAAPQVAAGPVPLLPRQRRVKRGAALRRGPALAAPRDTAPPCRSAQRRMLRRRRKRRASGRRGQAHPGAHAWSTDSASRSAAHALKLSLGPPQPAPPGASSGPPERHPAAPPSTRRRSRRCPQRLHAQPKTAAFPNAGSAAPCPTAASGRRKGLAEPRTHAAPRGGAPSDASSRSDWCAASSQ
jgi:hypothetical protein